MKNFLCFLLIGVILIFASCSKNNDVQPNEPNVLKDDKAVPVTLDNLDIHIESEISNGDRDVMFWFINNSDYTITYVQIRMKPKDGITKDDFVVKYNYGFGYPDDWDISYVFMDAKYEAELDAEYQDESNMPIMSGKTSVKESIYRNNIFYVRDIDEYNDMQPDILTIKYLDNSNEEQTIYYDYRSGKYNME